MNVQIVRNMVDQLWTEVGLTGSPRVLPCEDDPAAVEIHPHAVRIEAVGGEEVDHYRVSVAGDSRGRFTSVAGAAGAAILSVISVRLKTALKGALV